MESGIVTITIWYKDFQTISNLPAKLESALQYPSTKIVEFCRNHMRVQGEAALLEGLYDV